MKLPFHILILARILGSVCLLLDLQLQIGGAPFAALYVYTFLLQLQRQHYNLGGRLTVVALERTLKIHRYRLFMAHCIALFRPNSLCPDLLRRVLIPRNRTQQFYGFCRVWREEECAFYNNHLC